MISPEYVRAGVGAVILASASRSDDPDYEQGGHETTVASGATGHLSATIELKDTVSSGGHTVRLGVTDQRLRPVADVDLAFEIAAREACTIDPARSLVITDVSVVDDPVRTQYGSIELVNDMSVWNLGWLLHPDRAIATSRMKDLLTAFATTQMVDGVEVPPRPLPWTPIKGPAIIFGGARALLSRWSDHGPHDIGQLVMPLSDLIVRMDERDLTVGHAGILKLLFTTAGDQFLRILARESTAGAGVETRQFELRGRAGEQRLVQVPLTRSMDLDRVSMRVPTASGRRNVKRSLWPFQAIAFDALSSDVPRRRADLEALACPDASTSAGRGGTEDTSGRCIRLPAPGGGDAAQRRDHAGNPHRRGDDDQERQHRLPARGLRRMARLHAQWHRPTSNEQSDDTGGKRRDHPTRRATVRERAAPCGTLPGHARRCCDRTPVSPGDRSARRPGA